MGSLAVAAHDASSLLHPTMLAGGPHQQEETTTTPFYPPRPSPAPRSSSTYSHNVSQARAPARVSDSPRADPPRPSVSSSAPSQIVGSSRTHTSSPPTLESAPVAPASHSQDSPKSTAHTKTPSIVSSASSSAGQSPVTSHDVASAHASEPQSPPRIKVKSLQHIQSFVDDEQGPLACESTGSSPAPRASHLPQYEISDMPVADVIEMVAGLLSKITATNDQQAEHLHRNIPSADVAAGLSVQTSSVLAFHGKNVPTISIMSYLSRIHKYCPTTYEVFLSLLVYFDRITDKVNADPMNYLRQATNESLDPSSPIIDPPKSPSQPIPSASSNTLDTPEVNSPTSKHSAQSRRINRSSFTSQAICPSPPSRNADSLDLAHFFVVDSYNIHRLVIAGVTCASKFFSDIFYTNSRYAKVSLSFSLRNEFLITTFEMNL